MKHFCLNFIVLFVVSFHFTGKAYAQEKESAFDSIYVNTATILSAQDINRAIYVADSLLDNSQSSLQKMKSLMLIATLTGRKGDNVKALLHAIQAEKIARKDKNSEWQIRIAGFLSTTFRERNLNEEGEKYLLIAEEAVGKLDPSSPGLNIIKALLHQEKAYYRIGAKNYEAAIAELEKAETAILQTPEIGRNKIFLATNFQLFGTCFIGLGEYESAGDKLALALNELGEEESALKAFIYTDLAEIEMYNKNYDAAYDLFNKAEAYVETSDNFNIKSSLYKGLSNYYKIIGNQAAAIRYNELYTDYVKAYSLSTRDISHQLIQQLRLEKQEVLRRNFLLIGASSFLLLTVVFIILFFWRVRKKERIRYEKILTKIKESEPLFVGNQRSSNHKRDVRDALIMPKETEERILTELNKLEEGAFFTQKDISLSSLATRLNTNPKYLSYVINNYKGKDFNNYINELRIEFVIDKLHTEPEYLNYKLSYIADICGFSSHSKFAAVFKNATDLSPSVFISHLKKDVLEEA